MNRPSRARRILKWTGAGLSLLILGIWVMSLWVLIWIPGDFTVCINNGQFAVLDTGPVTAANFSGGTLQVHNANTLGLIWPRYSANWTPVQGGGDCPPILSVPYWLLILLTTIPTAWLWHRDRRRIRPGCCLRCGYDLTGNTSGVCSECGMAKPADVAGMEARRD